MEKALCDTTLINTSYQSNHSLQIESCKFREYPSGLAYYFQMNKCKNKITVARRKILENHFRFDFGMEQFDENVMDLRLLPYVLAWLGKSADIVSHSAMFQFL